MLRALRRWSQEEPTAHRFRSPPPPKRRAGPRRPAVQIQLLNDGGNRFEPANVTIPAGTTVTWTWVGGFHDVTPTGNPVFPAAEPLCPAECFSHTFNSPGTYLYFCSVHGSPSAACAAPSWSSDHRAVPSVVRRAPVAGRCYRAGRLLSRPGVERGEDDGHLRGPTRLRPRERAGAVSRLQGRSGVAYLPKVGDATATADGLPAG